MNGVHVFAPRRACRDVCDCTNARLQRKAAVYQRPVDVLAAVCVLVRNAGRTVRCGAINSSVTPITRRVDRDVLSRENRNYPLSPSAAILRPTLPSRIALKFRIIAPTFRPSSACCFALRALLTRFQARLFEKEPLRVETRVCSDYGDYASRRQRSVTAHGKLENFGALVFGV